MESYSKLNSQHPPCIDCFFAFSQKQVGEGIKEHKLEGKKLYNGGMGLVGTKEGIKNFYAAYNNRGKEIAEKCDPQEVYNYEFGNHECSYTCDDEDAIKIVINYFGVERAKTVKRKHGYYPIKSTT